MLTLQFTETKQLARESAARLNGFMDELRAGGKVRQCWVPPLHASPECRWGHEPADRAFYRHAASPPSNLQVDLSAKNLGEEGCAYVVEALAFNDR